MKIVAVLYPGGPAAENTPELLGCAENALGLRDMVEGAGHELVAITDPGDELDSHLPDTNVIITTPFWPTYVTREKIDAAPNLQMVLTAGVGSDHVDLARAAERNITVAEITGSNVVSVAEHTVMQILTLVRNYFPSYDEVVSGGWDIGKIAARSHDLEDKTVGIVGMGRIGQRVAARLKPFDVTMYYYDLMHLSTVDEAALGARYMRLDPLLRTCDVVTLHISLTPQTRGLFDKQRLLSMKKGRISHKHRPRRDRGHQLAGRGDGRGPPRRLRRRRLVPATRALRPPLALHAQPRPYAPRIRHQPRGPEALF